MQRALELDFPGTDPDSRTALVAAVEHGAQVVADVTTHQATDAELAKYFEDHRDKYSTEGTMVLRNLLLPSQKASGPEALATAQKAADELRAGTPLDEVMKTYGLQEQIPEHAGDEQFYFAEKIHLGDALFALAVSLDSGDVSAPTPADDGIHVIQMVKNTKPLPLTLERVRSQVLIDFNNEAKQRLENADERYLRDKAEILIADDYAADYLKSHDEKSEQAVKQAQAGQTQGQPCRAIRAAATRCVPDPDPGYDPRGGPGRRIVAGRGAYPQRDAFGLADQRHHRAPAVHGAGSRSPAHHLRWLDALGRPARPLHHRACRHYSGDQACKMTEGQRARSASPRRRRCTRRYEFAFECPDADNIKVNSSAWFELVASHTNFAQIQDDKGTFVEQLITKEQQTLDVESSSGASPLQNAGFLDFLQMGIMHIFTGVDHMSFMLGLVLISRRIRDLLFVVTGFTLGHSLTLALAVTGILRPEAQYIDALVALTIAMIGAENIGDSTHKPLLVALGMGGILFAMAFAQYLGAPVTLPVLL